MLALMTWPGHQSALSMPDHFNSHVYTEKACWTSKQVQPLYPCLIDVTVMCVCMQVRMANMEEIMDHYTFNKPPHEHADMRARVSDAVHSLLRSGAVTQSSDLFYPSFEQPGDYKMDLAGEVNMLRRPVVHALQQHPGIVHVEIDEHFMKDRHPAWFETWPYPRQ